MLEGTLTTEGVALTSATDGLDEPSPQEVDTISEGDLYSLLTPKLDKEIGADDSNDTGDLDLASVRKILSNFVFVANGLSKPFYFEKLTAKPISKDTFSRRLTAEMPLRDNGKPLDPVAIDRDLNICEVVDHQGYRPVEDLPIYRTTEGHTYANSYRKPEHPDYDPEMVTHAGRVLQAHMEYLFGREDQDRSGAVLLSYLAHIIQFPAKPALWALLLHGEAQGTGKTLVLSIVRNAIGASNFKNFDGKSLKEAFTSLGAEGLLHVIEEVHLEGTSRWTLLNDLKPFITNATVKVRKMYQDAYDLERYARIVATSNYPDALPVTEQDRRWCILQTYGFETTEAVNHFKETEEGKKHYKDLAELAEEQWGGAVEAFFKSYPIDYSIFDPTQPPETAAKRRMAHASRSDDTYVMLEAIEKHAGPDITTDSVVNVTRLRKLVEDSNTKAGKDFIELPKRKALGYALAALGFRSTPFKFDYGSSPRVKGQCFIHRKYPPDTDQFRELFFAAERGHTESISTADADPELQLNENF